MTGSALHCSGCEQLLRPLLTSVRPSRHLAAPVAHGRSNRSPRVIRATFLLMPVGSTSQRSVQVLGFGNFGYLTPLHRLIRFLFVRPAFCLGLPSDSQSPTTPLPLANTSPCRVCRGLSPPSRPAHHHSEPNSASHGATRHAWRTNKKPEQPKLLRLACNDQWVTRLVPLTVMMRTRSPTRNTWFGSTSWT